MNNHPVVLQGAEQKNTPFPLSDMQQAYWLGEQNGYRLRTPAIIYRSFFTKELDIARLADTLLSVTCRHPSLFTYVLEDGTQITACAPQKINVPLTDLRLLTPQQREAFLATRRQTIEENLPVMGQEPHFSCCVDQVDEGYYLHFILRLIAFDGRSIMIFFHEITANYLNLPLPSSSVSRFEDFIRERQSVGTSPAYQNSLQYWRERIHEIPGAPELPVVGHELIPEKSQFKRLRISLNPGEAQHLNNQARKCGVTLNAALCTIYADVLRLWSRNHAFTLNVLISQRPHGDKRFANVIGNFSNTLLLEVPANEGAFQERAKALQRQLYRDISHTIVSGVEVIRMLRRSSETSPAMPVVFASTLGMEASEKIMLPSDMGWSTVDEGLHTPQVWLDHQAYMDGDQLILNMDFADGVLLPNVAEEIFNVYTAHLKAFQEASFSENALLLPRLPQQFLSARLAANQTNKSLPEGLLHDFFDKACKVHADRPAILSDERTLSYRELRAFTTRLAAQLRGLGVKRNDLVAVVARRGWRQVAALMSVVQSGGAYLPIAADLPVLRKTYLAGQQGVKIVLAERELLQGWNIPEGVTALALEDVLPDGEPGEELSLEPIQELDDLAYVIFTSGSTGTPKGVAITHRGAVNTIQDVIARFGLDASDRVIGISSFNFDLSVFDIFGTLGTGAALVLPPHSSTPSPEEWARTVRQYGVTVWNSVPALLEMQIEWSGAKAAADLASLRLVMLSGDWIPVSLPGRLAAIAPQVKFISMGGATEASIWSNYFVVENGGDASWDSIPYGWPLSNQTFHILDKHLQPVPTWAAGDLYIGGIGLAVGYYNDPVRTAASFITHPETGERLYRTGDLGRYHTSGYIEFLGRNDNQVKIRGFRIELGEIEATLERSPGIWAAAAIVRTAGKGDRQVVAFYVKEKQQTESTEETLRAYLAKHLPDYMVPAMLIPIEHMPVTSNGKIDRSVLQSMAAELSVAAKESVAPRDEAEERLSDLWKTVLGVSSLGVFDNFFELGGTSLLAVRLLNAIKTAFDRQLPLASLLRYSTIANQAQLLTSESVATSASVRSPVVDIRQGGEGAVFVVHPVGGNVLCYREAARMIPAGLAVFGLQSPGDGSPRSLEGLALSYVQAIQPMLKKKQPLHLVGWSMGGVIAHEMAYLLERADIPVTSLTLIDSWTGSPETEADASLEGFPLIKNFVKDLLDGAPFPAGFDDIALLPEDSYAAAALQLLQKADVAAGQLALKEFAALLNEHRANFNALIHHRPKKIHTIPRLFRASLTSGFPLLAPFDCVTIEDKSPRAKAFIASLEENHFSIVRGNALQYIINEVFTSSPKNV